MIVYRIVREKYADDLTGRGGLLSTARWHNHLPVIYTSVSSSTAILEKLVHLQTGEIHNDLLFTQISIPDDAVSEKLEISDLPAEWSNYPAPGILKTIGNAWLTNKSALLLYVPSVIDPMAQNVLINPLHAQAVNLKIVARQPFRFDNRLLR